MNFAQQQRATPRKFGGFTAVILLHIVLVYALVSGSARQIVEVVRQPLMTKIIQEAKPPEPPPPPPPPPKLAVPPPPAFMPMPEIQIRQPPPVANVITQVTTTKPVEPPPPVAVPQPKAEPVRTAPVIDAAHSCRKPEYPAISKRLEEQGTVVLQFLIDVDGKVIDSKVQESSGRTRLDEAARQALALCSFKPGTLDGKPERSWAQLRYTWTLN